MAGFLVTVGVGAVVATGALLDDVVDGFVEELEELVGLLTIVV